MAGQRLVTVKEVAAMTTLAESTLFDWRAKGKGPRSFKFGARVVYVEAEVLAWIAAQQDDTSRGGQS
jgi:predicted DNA-binding transcriptional regulator AlpA